MRVSERRLEDELIEKLASLKYVHRTDIRGLEALAANFREKFERHRSGFTRDDGTPLNYTLVDIDDWCKNTFEVVNQLRVDSAYSHHRYDVLLLIDGVPALHQRGPHRGAAVSVRARGGSRPGGPPDARRGDGHRTCRRACPSGRP